ncbi:lytic transglycosylase domain-containing protein [Blastococcus sp. SYSU DS0617]
MGRTQERTHGVLLVAALVVGGAGLVAGLTASGDTPVAVARAEAPDDGRADVAVGTFSPDRLSAGAPPGAVTLAAQPVRGAEQQPAGTPVIEGLAANGIPNVALNAYRVAATRMNTTRPSCGIDWSLLAAIGRVESNHGRFGGAVLNGDGTSTPEIRGPALDGGQFAYIGDSDGGRFDHDTRYDRAVGAMQFIPTTWRSYAVDGDGNGTTDPFDIDDAALAAANYLCVAGRDLRTDSGQRRAVFAYNHSDTYVAQVLALARAYASGIPVATLPLVGDTSSPVPPPSGNYRAPAAPGPAIGAQDMTPASGDTAGVRTGTSQPPPPAPPAPPAPSGGGTPPPAAAGGTRQQNDAPAPRPAPAPAPLPAQPAPPPPAAAPAPAPAPLPVPLPLPLPSGPAPAAPALPAAEPVAELVPGVTCSLTSGLGLPLLPNLPLCPD